MVCGGAPSEWQSVAFLGSCKYLNGCIPHRPHNRHELRGGFGSQKSKCLQGLRLTHLVCALWRVLAHIGRCYRWTGAARVTTCSDNAPRRPCLIEGHTGNQPHFCRRPAAACREDIVWCSIICLVLLSLPSVAGEKDIHSQAVVVHCLVRGAWTCRSLRECRRLEQRDRPPCRLLPTLWKHVKQWLWPSGYT